MNVEGNWYLLVNQKYVTSLKAILQYNNKYHNFVKYIRIGTRLNHFSIGQRVPYFPSLILTMQFN